MLLVRLVDEWASFLPAATFDSFRADLGLTYRGAALALLAIGPGAIAGSAVTLLADTRSRRVLAAGGAAVYAAALALFAAATTPWMLLAGGAGVGLGATLLVDTVEVALADLCPDTGALERSLARETWPRASATSRDRCSSQARRRSDGRGACRSGSPPARPAAYGVLIACTPLPAPPAHDLPAPEGFAPDGAKARPRVMCSCSSTDTSCGGRACAARCSWPSTSRSSRS